MVQFGRATRFEELPDVPTARELAPTPEARTLIEFAEMPFLVSQPFVAPPGLPAARAAMLQTAFARMMRDPAFVEDAKRRRVELSPIDGQAALARDRTSGRDTEIGDREVQHHHRSVEPRNIETCPA